MKLSMFALGLGTLTVALSLTACGKKSEDNKGTTTTTSASGGSALRGSCTQKATALSPKRCSEDTEKSDPLELAKSFCEGMQGAWADKGGCGADARVASCAAKSGSTTYYYDSGDTSLDDAKSHCESILEGKLTVLAQPTKKAAAGGAAGAAGSAVDVSPEMKGFMAMLDGKDGSASKALKKYAVPAKQNDDLGMYTLREPQVTGTEKQGGNTCYTMTSKAGMMDHTTKVCWNAKGKIAEISDSQK